MAPSDVSLAFVLAVLLHSTFGYRMPMPEDQPVFLAPLENHTVTQGRDVSFTCVVNDLQSYKVAWIKSDSRAILAIHTHMVAHNPRISVTHNGHNTWKLHIANVQRNDSGIYMCQVNTNPMRSQMGYMEVVIPPDIMDLDDSTESLTTEEGGNVRLRCRATGTPAPEVTWRREDGRNIVLRNEYGVKRAGKMKEHVSGSGQVLFFRKQPHPSVGEKVTGLFDFKTWEGEQLHLSGILRQEMGSYLCIASSGVPPSVSKRYSVRVHFQPLIKVANQLVAAPANSDVIIQCYVEASPKAMNSWYRASGEKLLRSEKYTMSEVAISEYAYQLNMTIRKLEKNDFGSYVCSSENTFGKADGVVRLRELQLVETTIPSIRENELTGLLHGRSRSRSRPQGKKKQPLHGAEPEDRDDSSGAGSNEENLQLTTLPSSKLWSEESRGVPRPPVGPPPAPAPAPAHSRPTELVPLNDGSASCRRCRLETMTITVIAVALISRVC